ncbi:hypothetical protein KW796_01975 [Candidatus Parcubacteria bacterium]|nr:hypothetical protein [Candidatus Parcubacteria bacterium]
MRFCILVALSLLSLPIAAKAQGKVIDTQSQTISITILPSAVSSLMSDSTWKRLGQLARASAQRPARSRSLSARLSQPFAIILPDGSVEDLSPASYHECRPGTRKADRAVHGDTVIVTVLEC